jgi:uncharacterized protein
MPLSINLRHLELHDVRLEGELPVADLDLDIRDETIRTEQPLKYDIEVQKLEESLLLNGHLELTLDCECVRCLKAFRYPFRLDPWTCHVPLSGEESATIVNDLVDLTPYLREDILLGFPQHPLCEAECGGLPRKTVGEPETGRPNPNTPGASAWTDLNKLKF